MRGNVFVLYTIMLHVSRARARKGNVKDVAAKGGRTCSHTRLLRYQGPPSPYIPHRLDADNPEADNENYNEARKQRQAEHI
jgi:hypothetical protein